MTCGIQKMYNSNNNCLNFTIMEQEPKDLKTAQAIINELRNKCRAQAEQIMKWRKAYTMQVQQHYRYQKDKTDQMNSLTSQLLLLESRLKRKQKQIASIICHREMTILRQQKIIDALSSRLVDHGLDTLDPSYTDFDSLNDSDSAVVLEDIDSDCNSSLSMRRRSSSSGGCGDVTIVRSISDAIETNINKYSGARRTNCFLRRPDILETVYSVEEDPEPPSQQQQQQELQNQQQNNSNAEIAEKRGKFRNSSEKAITDQSVEGLLQADNDVFYKAGTSVENNMKQSQVTNFNRVMSNHRSVTKPKDVKYKRINKAKSKSLEELRGRLKNWVERGTIGDSGGVNGGHSSGTSTAINGSVIGINDNKLPQVAQSYA